METPYVTWHNEYIATGWWIFKQLFDRGLVYQDYRSTPHCPRCETSLSDHEVAQGYEENVPDPSIFIKFRLDGSGNAPLPTDREGAFVLAWTTTPWTLPGNVALAVHPEADYGIYEHEGERLLLAAALGLIGLIEMLYFLSSRLGVGSELVVYGIALDPEATAPWLAFAALAALGVAALRRSFPLAAEAWSAALAEARAKLAG